MKVFENISDYIPEQMRRFPFLSPDFYMDRFTDFYNKSEDVFDQFQSPHKRNFFEITLAIKESIPVNIGESTCVDNQNALEIISPFQVFSFGAIPSKEEKKNANPDEAYSIFFKSSFLHPARQPYEIQDNFPFFTIHTTPKYQFSAEQTKEFLDIFKLIFEEVKQPKEYSVQILQSYLNILLYKIKQVTTGEVKLISNNRFDLITSQYEQSISTNIDSFSTVREYASSLNISPIYLSECVKKSTGKSAQQILIDYKILHVKSILHQTNRPISDIANEIGFSELTNFTKFFKKNTGLTPSQFRKQKE